MWRLLSLQEKAHHERRAEGIREFHRTIRPTWQYSKRKDPTAGDKESASIAGTISSTPPSLAESVSDEGSEEANGFSLQIDSFKTEKTDQNQKYKGLGGGMTTRRFLEQKIFTRLTLRTQGGG